VEPRRQQPSRVSQWAVWASCPNSHTAAACHHVGPCRCHCVYTCHQSCLLGMLTQPPAACPSCMDTPSVRLVPQVALLLWPAADSQRFSNSPALCSTAAPTAACSQHGRPPANHFPGSLGPVANSQAGEGKESNGSGRQQRLQQWVASSSCLGTSLPMLWHQKENPMLWLLGGGGHNCSGCPQDAHMPRCCDLWIVC
jgi:hypothetical protein